MPKKIDKELGLNKAITRRDFVYGSSLIMGATYTGISGGAENTNDTYSFDVDSSSYGPGGCLLYTSPSPRD